MKKNVSLVLAILFLAFALLGCQPSSFAPSSNTYSSKNNETESVEKMNQGVLTTEKAQRAVNEFLRNNRSGTCSSEVKKCTITIVGGIREIPSQNSARANASLF